MSSRALSATRPSAIASTASTTFRHAARSLIARNARSSRKMSAASRASCSFVKGESPQWPLKRTVETKRTVQGAVLSGRLQWACKNSKGEKCSASYDNIGRDCITAVLPLPKSGSIRCSGRRTNRGWDKCSMRRSDSCSRGGRSLTGAWRDPHWRTFGSTTTTSISRPTISDATIAMGMAKLSSISAALDSSLA
ncbi:hypothetical protein ABIF14_004456 [Bradyrhizobium elkanii]